MKNIPGTLLIIRKIEKKKDYRPGYVSFYRNNYSDYICLTYGEPVVLISFLPNILKKRNHTNLFYMKVLWRNQLLDTNISNLNANKWFITYDNWINNGYDQKYNDFLENGKLIELWKYYRIQYRLE